MIPYIPRVPWPPNYPDVVIHGDIKSRDHHPAYTAAKSGDAEAAVKLAREFLTDDGISQIKALVQDRNPIVCPVSAIETTGFNAIPDAMASHIASQLDLSVAAYDIGQTNYVGHTRADGWHRLATPATFGGSVRKGATYFLMDDHVGFGGTLANMRGYIEINGGLVIGMTTLTETGGAKKIALQPDTGFMLQSKHGNDLNTFWKDVFGHGTSCLTNVEAGYISRAESVTTVKDRLAQAAAAARGRGLSPIRFSP